jgi:hypothetical protein
MKSISRRDTERAEFFMLRKELSRWPDFFRMKKSGQIAFPVTSVSSSVALHPMVYRA